MNAFSRNFFRITADLIYKVNRLDVFGTYKWLKETLSWSSEQRLRWKVNKLGDILEFAWNHVPFYREYWGDHGVEFKRPNALEELQKYPILSKEVFRANASRIQPDNLNFIRHQKRHTGGTTGEPVHYLKDLEQWTLGEAFHLWGWSQLGYKYGDPIGVIAGGSLIPKRNTFINKVRGWMQRRLFLYGVAMDRKIAVEYQKRLVKYGVKFLYGYPSVLYLFGKYLKEEGLSIPGLKAIVTTGEMLIPMYREGIERNFGCEVFNNLGGNDGGYESYECHFHDGFHYNDLQSVLEVDSSDNYGEGRLIITNLWNKSTPFIRYEIGDLVTLRNSPCPCGAPFPMISSIRGRTADILTFANGKSLSGPALTLIFGEMEIDGWQVVQTGYNCLEIRMCNSSGIKPEYLDHVHKILRHYLGDDVEIVIKHVEKLETTRAGKWKPIWNEVGAKIDNSC